MAPELAGLDAAGMRALLAALSEEDPFCQAPPEEAASKWSESRLRTYFEAGGVDPGAESVAGSVKPAFPAPLTREQASVVPPVCSRASSSAVHLPPPFALLCHRRSPSTRRPAQRSSGAGSRAWTGAHGESLSRQPVSDAPPAQEQDTRGKAPHAPRVLH